MRRAFRMLGLGLAVLLAVLAVRAASMRSHQVAAEPAPPVERRRRCRGGAARGRAALRDGVVPGRSRTRRRGVPRLAPLSRGAVPEGSRDAGPRARRRAQPPLHLARHRAGAAAAAAPGAPGRGARRAGHRSQLAASCVRWRHRRRIRLGPRRARRQGEPLRAARGRGVAPGRRLAPAPHGPAGVRSRRGAGRRRGRREDRRPLGIARRRSLSWCSTRAARSSRAWCPASRRRWPPSGSPRRAT